MQVHDLQTGKLLWTFEGDGEFSFSPILTKNYIYVSSYDDNTYILDRTTHELVWQIPHGGWMAVANGFLYITSEDSVVRAYRAAEP